MKSGAMVSWRAYRSSPIRRGSEWLCPEGEGVSAPPVPVRNCQIGEMLKELRLAEGLGTGIPKVRRTREQNGSPPPRFDFDKTRSYFPASRFRLTRDTKLLSDSESGPTDPRGRGDWGVIFPSIGPYIPLLFSLPLILFASSRLRVSPLSVSPLSRAFLSPPQRRCNWIVCGQ